MYDYGDLPLINLMPTAAVAFVGATNGAGVNVSTLIGKARAVLDSAAGTGASPTLVVKLQDSPDNSIWTDVPNGAFAQVTNAGASQQALRVDADALNTWVRAVATEGGTTPSFIFSVNLLGRKQVFP